MKNEINDDGMRELAKQTKLLEEQVRWLKMTESERSRERDYINDKVQSSNSRRALEHIKAEIKREKNEKERLLRTVVGVEQAIAQKQLALCFLFPPSALFLFASCRNLSITLPIEKRIFGGILTLLFCGLLVFVFRRYRRLAKSLVILRLEKGSAASKDGLELLTPMRREMHGPEIRIIDTIFIVVVGAVLFALAVALVPLGAAMNPVIYLFFMGVGVWAGLRLIKPSREWARARFKLRILNGSR